MALTITGDEIQVVHHSADSLGGLQLGLLVPAKTTVRIPFKNSVSTHIIILSPTDSYQGIWYTSYKGVVHELCNSGVVLPGDITISADQNGTAITNSFNWNCRYSVIEM